MQNLKYQWMNKKIKRVYIPYTEWEDFKNGMWSKLPSDNEPEMLLRAIEFTGNWNLYGEAMGDVLTAWPKTILNSLTNASINRRAFLGHCACQFKIGCPEYLTRQAWKELTDRQRFDADSIAQKHIDNWIKNYERENRKVYKGLGEQLLFRWAT